MYTTEITVTLPDPQNRLRLTVENLDEIDEAYPIAARAAIAQGIAIIDIYRGGQFITSVDVIKNQTIWTQYDRLLRSFEN